MARWRNGLLRRCIPRKTNNEQGDSFNSSTTSGTTVLKIEPGTKPLRRFKSHSGHVEDRSARRGRTVNRLCRSLHLQRIQVGFLTCINYKSRRYFRRAIRPPLFYSRRRRQKAVEERERERGRHRRRRPCRLLNFKIERGSNYV